MLIFSGDTPVHPKQKKENLKIGKKKSDEDEKNESKFGSNIPR